VPEADGRGHTCVDASISGPSATGQAVVSPAPRSATITALEPTETLALHRDQINRVRLEHPGVDQVLLEAVVGEVRRLSVALLEAMYSPVPTRLARQLVGLTRTYPADAKGRIVIPLTQDDLAGLCGTTRATVNQLIGKLADKKLLKVARGRVIITDLPGLARTAG
jgi:CRP/FNR family transcriptional regulator, cyclic AMP receptor protein